MDFTENLRGVAPAIGAGPVAAATPAKASRCRWRAPITRGALALLVAGLGGCSKSPEELKAAAAEEVARTTGGLLVKSNRPDATIEVTSTTVPAGATPTSVDGTVNQPLATLPAGQYAVVVRAEGWPELYGAVDVAAGRTTEVTMNFKSGSLHLDSVPSGAIVKLGKTIVGQTPLLILELPAGECRLTLEYPSWPVQTFQTTITENVESHETVRLPHGKLVVESSPAGATVLLAKRTLGQTPLTLDPIPAGLKRLTLQAKDFPPLEVSVTVEDRGEAKVTRELGLGFPALDPSALLTGVWVADNPGRITASFEITGRFAPQNGIVKNLNRQKLHDNWLGRRYRFTGTVKAYDVKDGEIEFAEDKNDLTRYRLVAKLSATAREDPRLAAPTLKGATLTLHARLVAVEEPRWPAKLITFELSGAELLQGDAP